MSKVPCWILLLAMLCALSAAMASDNGHIDIKENFLDEYQNEEPKKESTSEWNDNFYFHHKTGGVMVLAKDRNSYELPTTGTRMKRRRPRIFLTLLAGPRLCVDFKLIKK